MPLNCPRNLKSPSLGTNSRRTQIETNICILTKAVQFSDFCPRVRTVIDEIGETVAFSELGSKFLETSVLREFKMKDYAS